MIWRQARRKVLPSSFLQVRANNINGDTLAALAVASGCTALLVEAYYRTKLHDADAPDDCVNHYADSLIQARHVQALQTQGLVVIPKALSSSQLALARRDVARFQKRSSGPVEEARFEATTNDADVRQDQVAWISSSESSLTSKDTQLGEGLSFCIDLVRGVTSALLKHDYEGSSLVCHQHQHHYQYRVPQLCQLAMYPGNGSASYQRHLDQCNASLSDLGILEWFRLSDYRGRAITVILYLNDPERTLADGGALRCWVAKLEPPTNLKHLKNQHLFEPSFDIQPTGGTMIIFQSDRVEHMVLPSCTDRFALTSWVDGRATT